MVVVVVVACCQILKVLEVGSIQDVTSSNHTDMTGICSPKFHSVNLVGIQQRHAAELGLSLRCRVVSMPSYESLQNPVQFLTSVVHAWDAAEIKFSVQSLSQPRTAVKSKVRSLTLRNRPLTAIKKPIRKTVIKATKLRIELVPLRTRQVQTQFVHWKELVEAVISGPRGRFQVDLPEHLKTNRTLPLPANQTTLMSAYTT